MKTGMQVILAQLDLVLDNIINIDTKSDKHLKESLLTEVIGENQVVIGDWKIIAHTDSGRKLYDVVKIGQFSPVVRELTIYTAAHGLVSALNDGLSMNSKFIIDILRLEREYASALHDAIHSKNFLEKHTSNSSKEDNKSFIMEDKYDAAVRKAKHIYEKLLQLVAEKYPFLVE